MNNKFKIFLGLVLMYLGVGIIIDFNAAFVIVTATVLIIAGAWIVAGAMLK